MAYERVQLFSFSVSAAICRRKVKYLKFKLSYFILVIAYCMHTGDWQFLA